MPLSKQIAFSVGVWNPSDGFFNLDHRLARVRVAAGLTLPLAPRPIFMAENAVVNATVHNQFGFAEAYIREQFLKYFRAHCKVDGSSDFLFADSGSNEGTWSMVAAAYGCQVVAIDPQPLCVSMLQAAAARSGFTIEAHNNILAPESSNAPPLQVPSDQCHGTSEYHVALGRVSDVTKEGRNQLARRAIKKPVTPRSFDDIIGSGRTVALWHLDVEGAEIPVLNSAKVLFEQRRIHRVMLEFIPFRWPAQNVSIGRGHMRHLEYLFSRSQWRCHVVCPTYPQHHEKPFNFTLAYVRAHIEYKNEKGAMRTYCENIYCEDKAFA